MAWLKIKTRQASPPLFKRRLQRNLNAQKTQCFKEPPLKEKQRQKNERTGRLAEHLARLYLFFKRYHLLESRYQNPLGEIDLIFKRGKTLIFCEVKFRQTKDQGLEALTPRQQTRIQKGAQFYLAKNPRYTTSNMRFDYVLFYKWGLKHIKNAW